MQARSAESQYEIVVIGAGIFGSSISWEAARRGRKTLLLERQAVPNPIAASFGPSRKIRSTYVEPHYARLAQEAMAAWRVLEAELGLELYLPVGNLAYTELEAQPHLDELERVSREVGSELELLDQAALRRRFPQFKRARRALFERQAGYLRATTCVTTMQQQAVQLSGRPGVATPLVNPSPLGGEERIVVYTAIMPDGATLFYYLTVVPTNDAAAFNEAFQRIIGSLRLAEAR